MTFTIGTALAVGGLALSATSAIGASKTASTQAAARISSRERMAFIPQIPPDAKYKARRG